MAKFSHYAIAAARQAINDAQWIPETDSDKERTVSDGNGCNIPVAHTISRVCVLVLAWEVWKILLTLQLLIHQA